MHHLIALRLIYSKGEYDFYKNKISDILKSVY